jgi:hypothetical protein
MSTKVNKKSRDAVRFVLDALFERAKARLLGRYSNSIFFQVVRDFGVDKSTEGMARYSFASKFGVDAAPDSEILETQADEASSFIDALKQKTTAQMLDAIKNGDPSEIKDIFKKTTDNLEMIVAEEINRASNLSIADGIDQVASSQGIEDPTVFSIGPLDVKTCKYCLSMYHCKSNPKIPRVYRRSQLSTAFFKPKEWDGKTIHLNAHPRCRHSLTVLMPGFGFDSNGKVTYIGKDHDEYEAQKKRGDTE